MIVGFIILLLATASICYDAWRRYHEPRSRLKARTNLQLAAGRQSRNGYLQRGRLPDFLTGSDKPNKG